MLNSYSRSLFLELSSSAAFAEGDVEFKDWLSLAATPVAFIGGLLFAAARKWFADQKLKRRIVEGIDYILSHLTFDSGNENRRRGQVGHLIQVWEIIFRHFHAIAVSPLDTELALHAANHELRNLQRRTMKVEGSTIDEGPWTSREGDDFVRHIRKSQLDFRERIAPMRLLRLIRII